MKGHMKSLATAVALATGLHSAAFADIAEVETEEGDVMTFEYEGDRLRINTPDNEQGYMLMRDGKMYVVTQNEGQPMVFDMSSAFKMFGSMAANATPSTVESKVLSLEATGRSETLGGIQGEVYELRFIDHNGKEQQADMVLSKDPLARGFRDAIQSMAMTMADSLDKDTFKSEIEAGEQMQAKLQDLNMGVLRYGKDMQIRSIKDTSVDAARFELPAQPTDLGGMLRGAFGGGATQNSDDAPANGEDSKSSAEAVGEAVGEAFGKIFGN